MRTIATEDLKRAYENGEIEQIYDSRGPGSYQTLHIKGAKQLSVSDTTEDNLPDNKQAMLVFY